jgi:hypothetical protein
LIKATASISSNLDKAFPFSTNHGKPLISVFLLNKPLVLLTNAFQLRAARPAAVRIGGDVLNAEVYAKLAGSLPYSHARF